MDVKWVLAVARLFIHLFSCTLSKQAANYTDTFFPSSSSHVLLNSKPYSVYLGGAPEGGAYPLDPPVVPMSIISSILQ
jgi:hypothetical protein